MLNTLSLGKFCELLSKFENCKTNEFNQTVKKYNGGIITQMLNFKNCGIEQNMKIILTNLSLKPEL